MFSRLLFGLALLCASLGAGAQDSRAQTSLQKLIDREVFDRIESAEGKATLTVGKYFYSSEFESQQDVVRSVFDYLKSQDAAVTKLMLIDAGGRMVGEYSQNRLTLRKQ